MSEKPTPPVPENEPGKEVEKYVRGDIVPAGAKTTKEIVAIQAAEAAKTPEERVAYLEALISKQRSELADRGAKRSTRAIFKGKKNYEVAHGEYTKTMQDLIRAKLEMSGVSDNEKKFQAMQLLDDEWSTLRGETKENMDGTITGKLVKWLGDEDISKKRRIMRTIGFSVGVAAAGTLLGAATLGVGGGAVAGAGVGMALRGYKGFVTSVARSDRKIKDQTYGSQLEVAQDDNVSFDDVINAGVGDTSYTENVAANSKESSKAGAKTVAFILGGAAVGHALDHYDVGSKVWNGMFGGEAPTAAVAAMGVPQSGTSFREAEMRQWGEYRNNVGRFDYNLNKDKNPFFPLDAKPSTHAMGPALVSNPEYDMGIDGWTDLVQNRWVNSPEQFASVVSAMGIDGLPSDIDSADALAERFKVMPSRHAELHGKVIELLQEPTTKVYEEPILSDYASEYGVGNPANKDVDLAWDPVVGGQRGTKIVIEFKDPNTGEMRKLELRKECGGQRIVEFQPTPVHEVPRSVWNPNTPVVTVDTPTTPKPPVVTPPTPENPQPPVVPPNPPNPPQPPVGVPKNPTVDINVNEGLPTDIRMGEDRFGSGAPQTEQEVTTPAEQYAPPVANQEDTESVAPGAQPSSPQQQSPPQQSGSSTGAGSGSSGTGTTSGSATES